MQLRPIKIRKNVLQRRRIKGKRNVPAVLSGKGTKSKQRKLKAMQMKESKPRKLKSKRMKKSKQRTLKSMRMKKSKQKRKKQLP
jgi:hypothetical protein